MLRRRSPTGATGFSLVELAVALAIVGLVLGSLTLPLSAQNDLRMRRETDKSLGDIRDALIGFAIVNGRLPCPAVATMAAGEAGAGSEARNDRGCLCARDSGSADAAGEDCARQAVTGVLPWNTLGLPETDSYGRRFTYGVDPRFGRLPGQGAFGCEPAAIPLRSGFALCSSGRIAIKAGSGGASLVSGGTPAIVVSHGRNGYGAYAPQGLRIQTQPAADPGEQENANGDETFVSNPGFDDQLVWIATPILMQRMLAAGMLP